MRPLESHMVADGCGLRCPTRAALSRAVMYNTQLVTSASLRSAVPSPLPPPSAWLLCATDCFPSTLEAINWKRIQSLVTRHSCVRPSDVSTATALHCTQVNLWRIRGRSHAACKQPCTVIQVCGLTPPHSAAARTSEKSCLR